MKLSIEPRDGLVDTPPAIRVEGVEAGAGIGLTVATTDAAGHDWRSEAQFRADDAGVVDLVRDQPEQAGYSGPDASGPFWSMQFTSEDRAPVAFEAPTDSLVYEVSARAGNDVATEQATRRWFADGIEREELRGEGFRGPLLAPAHDRVAPGVVLIPASTGARALEPTAALLASHGYAAFVLGYMQGEGLPPSLTEIPIEVLLTGIEALRGHERVDGRRIGLIAGSVGTQGALAALSIAEGDPVSCAVAIAPSSVIWQALPEGGQPPKTAAWSHGGEPLPWLAMHGGRVLPEVVKHALLDRFARHPKPKALHLLPAYEKSLDNRDAVQRAAIPVERIGCPLLLISGEDDQMWPGSAMARAVVERRQDRGAAAAHADRHLSLPDAGHFVRPPVTPTTVPWNESLVSGGTAAGNARAQREAWAAMLAFLAEHLSSESVA